MDRQAPEFGEERPGTPPEGDAGWVGVPGLPTQFVRRHRLLDLLDRAADAPVVLVSGPPGSGKTSLVADWVSGRSDRHPTAWITFEGGDEEFWPGLVGCLAQLGVPLPAPPWAVANLDHRILAAIASAVAAHPERITLVVDGYEVVDPAVARDLDFLVRHNGRRLQLVIVTRADPVMPLYRYRLEDTVAEVRMAELAFTDAEVAQLMEKSGVALTEPSVRALNLRTRGWVTGLRFAARILQDREDPDQAVAEVAGDSGNIGEYLMGEVLAAQTDEVRELLLNTSVPDTLRPGLTEELGGHSASRTLAFLTRMNAFIDPVPNHPGFYRYHPFFRELLRAELSYQSPETMKRLQRKAADWFSREGLMAAAVNHYAAIDAWGDAAAGVVDEMVIGQLLLDGGSSALARSLQEMPARLDAPAAAVVRATLALARGDDDGFDEQLPVVSESPGGGPTTSSSVSMATALLRAVRAGHGADLTEAIALGDAAERVFGRDENLPITEAHPELIGLVLASKGIATARQGQLERADELFAAAASTAADVALLLVECQGWQALIACLRGQLPRAHSMATSAGLLAESLGVPSADRPVAALVALAWVDVERYEIGPAVQRVETAEASHLVGKAPVPRAVLAIVKSRLLAAQGDRAGAISCVDRAMRELVDLEPWLVERLHLEATRLRVANGEPEVALLEIEGLATTDAPAVALAVAEVNLALGHADAAGSALVGALVKGAPVDVRVAGWLVEVGRQLRSGSGDAARAALSRSLRLAEPGRLRRPIREAPLAVQQLLRHDAALRSKHRWIKDPDMRRGPSRAVLPSQQRAAGSPGQPPMDDVPVVESLTERELEVLGHLAELLTTEEIASTMFISVNTIRTHVRSILRKLGVSRRNAAVRRARELQLLAR